MRIGDYIDVTKRGDGRIVVKVFNAMQGHSEGFLSREQALLMADMLIAFATDVEGEPQVKEVAQ